MRGKFTSKIVLASQLFAVSAGLGAITAQLVKAQTQPGPAMQRMSKEDLELTRKIRKAIVADKSLSVEAHNIHIAAQNGGVTLIGKVKSDDEKKSLEDKATEIAGAGKVTNNLTVAQK